MKAVELFTRYRSLISDMEQAVLRRGGFTGVSSPRFGIAVDNDKYATVYQDTDKKRSEVENELISILEKYDNFSFSKDENQNSSPVGSHNTPQSQICPMCKGNGYFMADEDGVCDMCENCNGTGQT